MVKAKARSSDRILMKALDLFSDKGYDASSVREICEAAGITKPTLYHFYRSKEGVYQALVVGALEDFRGRLLHQLEAPGTAGERLKRMARAYFDVARTNRKLMRLIFSLVHNPPSSAPRTDFASFYADVVRRVGSVIEAGVASGELAPGALEVRLLILMGALGESLCGYLILGRPDLEPDLANRIVDSLLEGWQAKP